jgi:uncharacterized protein YjiK
VQDEKGKVYICQSKTGEILESVSFGEAGDYEGIANVNDTIWVLASNGNLQRITDFNSDKQKVKEYKTPLDTENDTEGLCYDETENRLLIACKSKAGKEMKGFRAVYGFHLGTLKISEQPVLRIQLDAIKSWLLQNEEGKFVANEIENLFGNERADVSFQPSEIAVHPLTGEIYVLAARGNLLVVTDRAGKIQNVNSLDPDLLKQPEGITFLPNGDMYISDEGKDGTANLLLFKYMKK